MTTLTRTDLEHFAARAQGSILGEVDRVEDDAVRDRIRRTVLDQIELFRHRVAEKLQIPGEPCGPHAHA